MTQTHLYRAELLSCRFGDLQVLRDLDFFISRSEILGIAGPNGAGKTTLVRALGGLLRNWSGRLEFEGKSILGWKRSELARKVAYLPQKVQITFPYTAREVVLMGRLPHQRRAFFESREDHEIVDQSLAVVGSGHLGGRFFNELSGGEQQLVGLASAIAQEPEVLLLDEPTAFLDLRHQLQILKVLRDLHDRRKTALVIVSHDLNLVQTFCDRIFFLKEGALQACLSRDPKGSFPISRELLERVFDVTADLDFREGQERITLSFGR